MKRSRSINRFPCWAAICSLVGRLVLVGVCAATPVADVTQVALARPKPHVAAAPAASAWAGDSRLPVQPGSMCSAAERCGVDEMLKSSDRANPSTITAKLVGRVPQSPRPTLRVPSRASSSRVLWLETCASSLSARHVRMQI
ncbi:MAG TPA: hypothetical protein VG826_21480 [Pirellulales bacterium]|nr:hypothetical protein [Pirellulales bacterium]